MRFHYFLWCHFELSPAKTEAKLKQTMFCWFNNWIGFQHCKTIHVSVSYLTTFIFYGRFLISFTTQRSFSPRWKGGKKAMTALLYLWMKSSKTRTKCPACVHLLSCVICGWGPGHVPAGHPSTCATCHHNVHTETAFIITNSSLTYVPILTKYLSCSVLDMLESN